MGPSIVVEGPKFSSHVTKRSCVLFLNIVMGIKTLQVILKDTVEGGPGVFFSGSSVAGAVHISVDGESQTAKGVRVECNGKARVRWQEPRDKRVDQFTNQEDYVEYSTNLLGS